MSQNTIEYDTNGQSTKSKALKKHTISILVENRFGAFNRIAGLFSAKGYNLDSITVGPSDDDSVSRMTIVVEADDNVVEQITKNLNKLIDTVKVVDLTYESFVERELVLIKVCTSPETRSEIMQIVDIFRAKIVDISPKTMTVEATGGNEKVDAIVKMLKPFVIKEIARTGRVAMKREYRGDV